MKIYFLLQCLLAYKSNPVEWEWQDAMAITKNKFPKSSVSRKVFETKWLNEFKTKNWENIKRDFKGIMNYNDIVFKHTIK